MNGSAHVTDLVADYALGLLAPGLCQQVEAHTATCEACRRQLSAERRLTARVRVALNAVPAPARITATCPAPERPARPRMWATWARAWALALLVAALAGSGLIRGNRGAHEPWLPGAAVAATATALPTATSTPQATRPAHIHPLASPTPVAALPGETLSTN